MSSQLPEWLEREEREGGEQDKFRNVQCYHATARPSHVSRPAASTHHCRMLESIGLEKMGGEVLVTVGLGSKPSISRKKCALRGHPVKTIRARAGPMCPAALPQMTYPY